MYILVREECDAVNKECAATKEAYATAKKELTAVDEARFKATCSVTDTVVQLMVVKRDIICRESRIDELRRDAEEDKTIIEYVKDTSHGLSKKKNELIEEKRNLERQVRDLSAVAARISEFPGGTQGQNPSKKRTVSSSEGSDCDSGEVQQPAKRVKADCTNSSREETPCPPDPVSTKSRVIVCIRCSKANFRCDNDLPCGQCNFANATCRRAKYARYTGDACKNTKCTRAHEEDGLPDYAIVQAGYVPRSNEMSRRPRPRKS